MAITADEQEAVGARIWTPRCPRCQRSYKPIRLPDDEVIRLGSPQCPKCLDVLWVPVHDLIPEAKPYESPELVQNMAVSEGGQGVSQNQSTQPSERLAQDVAGVEAEKGNPGPIIAQEV